MHTIFAGDKPIILTTELNFESKYKCFLLKSVNIGKVLKLLNTTDLKGVYLVHKNESKLIDIFLNLLPVVKAGGGKVFNEQGEILFIYRNDKWDLPKGKSESNESIEETAMREVEEETGVTGLSIIKSLPTTYHIFKRSGRHKIKVTYWFEMKTSFSGKLFPQLNEGITKVEWLDNNACKIALENSYANIKLLV